MRYLFLDRIQFLDRNVKIVAIKNVALSEDVYTEHFFGFPVMPGALLIECLAQAGTALLEVSLNYQKKAILILVDQAKFRSIVRPGDQLIVTANVISSGNESVQMDGTIHVSERPVMNARIAFALKNVEEFYPSKVRPFVESIYDVWLRDAQLIGFHDR